MYYTCSEGKSVVAERFISTLKGRIYKKLMAYNSCSYLDYLDKLVDEYDEHLSSFYW